MAWNNEQLKEHRATWGGFIRAVIVGTAVAAVTLGLMAIFLL